jgi:phage-related protein
MGRKTQRRISWIKAAERSFRDFPLTAQQKTARALTQIGDGDTPEIAKPLHGFGQGFGSGVWELAIKDRSDAFRVVYVLQLDEDIWVVHAFQKKSTKGITTPKHEIDLIRDRIKRLKEALDG